MIPVLRVRCPLPDAIQRHNPLYVDLTDDKDPKVWERLLNACGVELGAYAPDWLPARDELVRFLEDRKSVNLVVIGRPKWREMIEHLREDYFKDLGIVDLDSGLTASRRGLVAEILKGCGAPAKVAAKPEDLVMSHRGLSEKSSAARLAFLHFDRVSHRDDYGMDLFSAIRVPVMDARKLVLLVQSRSPFAALLSSGHPLSSISIQTVELRGQAMSPRRRWIRLASAGATTSRRFGGLACCTAGRTGSWERWRFCRERRDWRQGWCSSFMRCLTSCCCPRSGSR